MKTTDWQLIPQTEEGIKYFSGTAVCRTVFDATDLAGKLFLDLGTVKDVGIARVKVNGKKEGVMTEYYKDGKIKGDRLFKNDIQIGKSTFYYPSGKVKEVQYYEEGKITGGDTL